MKHCNLALIMTLMAGLGLAGCSNAKESLGLTRKSPDEFAVVKRAPLAMPPDYELRPPEPGAPRPQEQAQDEQARAAVFGRESEKDIATPRTPASAEAFLLQQTGATQADPAIRAVVDREAAETDESKKPVADRLLGWTGMGSDEPSASVVDAAAEAERLKTNQKTGQPITAGETPSKVK